MSHAESPLFIPGISLCHDAAIEHSVPPDFPHFRIHVQPIAIILNLFICELNRTIHPCSGGVPFQAFLFQDVVIPIQQHLVQFAQSWIHVICEHFCEHSKAGGHSNSVGVVRAGMKNSSFIQHVEHILPSAECSHWKTTADCLCETDQIGLEAEVLAGASSCEFHAGFYFIHDKQ